jgi:valyl-tRNA synthetase
MDVEAETLRLNQEKDRLEKELDRSEKILSNKGFLAKAPKEKVDSEKQKQTDYRRQLDAVLARLSELGR